jgi:uncharacterized protein with PQ loop repeat
VYLLVLVCLHRAFCSSIKRSKQMRSTQQIVQPTTASLWSLRYMYFWRAQLFAAAISTDGIQAYELKCYSTVSLPACIEYIDRAIVVDSSVHVSCMKRANKCSYMPYTVCTFTCFIYCICSVLMNAIAKHRATTRPVRCGAVNCVVNCHNMMVT